MAKIQNKRPKNRNQILKEVNYENLKSKLIIKELQRELENIKKQNYKLQKERRELKLQLRFANFETIKEI